MVVSAMGENKVERGTGNVCVCVCVFLGEVAA